MADHPPLRIFSQRSAQPSMSTPHAKVMDKYLSLGTPTFLPWQWQYALQQLVVEATEGEKQRKMEAKKRISCKYAM